MWFCALLLLAVHGAAFPARAFAPSTKETTPTAESGKNKIFNARSFELANGLKIVVVENWRAPVVTHMVWYKVGAADETPGKSGIAHFMEHLMFKGQKSKISGDIAPGDFSKIIRSLGGNDNAFTTQDYTAYYQSVASEYLGKVMAMEAGRMEGMAPTREEVASENKVILEERRMRTDNDPGARLREQIMYALFPNHPYGTPIIGWLKEMAGLTYEDAMSFHASYYVPNNAILVVSGAVKAEDVVKLAEETYGQIPRRDDIKERHFTESPPFAGDDEITMHDAQIHQPQFSRVFRAPSPRENKDDSLALEVLENILSAGSTSILYKSLVVDQKLASGIGLSYSDANWSDATVWISATPADGVSITALQKAIEDKFRALIKDGIPEEEVTRARLRMQADAIYARDSLTGPAMVLGYNLITGSSLRDIEYWDADLNQVSAKDVNRVLSAYLNPDAPGEHPPVTGYLLPEGGDINVPAKAETGLAPAHAVQAEGMLQ